MGVPYEALEVVVVKLALSLLIVSVGLLSLILFVAWIDAGCKRRFSGRRIDLQNEKASIRAWKCASRDWGYGTLLYKDPQPEGEEVTLAELRDWAAGVPVEIHTFTREGQLREPVAVPQEEQEPCSQEPSDLWLTTSDENSSPASEAMPSQEPASS